MLTAVRQGDDYTLYGSADLYSANVYKLSFADINSDGTQEIIVSFDHGSSAPALQAYLLGDGLNSLSVAEGFTDYTVGDFDDNASADILLMKPAEGKTAAKASLLAYGDGGFSEKSACDVDSDVQSYVDLRFGKISDGISGAIADGVLENEPFRFSISSAQLPTYGMCTDISRFYTFVDGRFLEFYPDEGDVLLWDHLTEELHRFQGGKWQNTNYRHHED